MADELCNGLEKLGTDNNKTSSNDRYSSVCTQTRKRKTLLAIIGNNMYDACVMYDDIDRIDCDVR